MADVILEAGGHYRDLALAAWDFGDADLTDAVFEGCAFTEPQAQGVCLQGVRFRGCRLVRARFAHADLREAVFEDCSFADDAGHAGVRIAFSRLDQAELRRCDLSFARLERSDLYGVQMEDCNLRGAVFEKLDFSRTIGRADPTHAAAFRRCNLELADLEGLDAPRCEFAGTGLREAVLVDANLEGADLRGCDLFQALVRGAKLARADLRGAEVSGLDLLELESRDGLKVTGDQQHRLLTAMGLDVYAD
ncbi:MAG: pentapeptide repeat-containing protein [Pseudomonadota bacterium]